MWAMETAREDVRNRLRLKLNILLFQKREVQALSLSSVATQDQSPPANICNKVMSGDPLVGKDQAFVSSPFHWPVLRGAVGEEGLRGHPRGLLLWSLWSRLGASCVEIINPLPAESQRAMVNTWLVSVKWSGFDGRAFCGQISGLLKSTANLATYTRCC